ncbi:DUF6384 family protein [Pseudomonas sichuanensis]|uniref:DUF6384 family protein n=1 Tax=Pseudomonas sichuanensis TaxID=2213015 RepID=UPI0013009D9B|nr:DUF6384 family protein [Pseudomonas sichuanensis]
MTVSLSEQMGAMALVDELRHRDMELQDHLDLPRRRAEVAERIRAYYQNNGIHYEDAQIEEGVRAFFSRRLMFEAPTLNFAQRLLTRLAMAHRKLMIWAACGVMACALGLGINHLVDTAQNTRVGQSADRLARINEQLNQDIAVQRQRLGQVKARLEQQPQPLVAALVAKIDPLLPSASLPFTLDRPDPITRENRAQLQARIQRAQQQLSTPRKQLESARKRLNRVDHLYASLDLQRHLLDRLKAMPLPAAERLQMKTWAESAGKDIARLQLKKADATLAALKDYLDFATEPLTLELIDRPGIKSGVERCYEASGCSENSLRGKSWYLIVEPLDSTGKPAFAPVTSVEDGTTRWASRFGVRVSYNEYLRVRQDKLDDGHISQRLIGEKPANSLTLRFNQRISPAPDMILEW